ncbi:MAG TPA: hypothetical protein VEK75_01525, partial [Xanthobacteraceae bacterium]|nr:hypothetical protein [Xanthobacteraceae bacterium]
EPAVEHVRKKARHKTAAAHPAEGKKAIAKPREGKPAAERTDGKTIDGKVADRAAADAKAAAAAPWTPLSASTLAANPPAELKTAAPAAAVKKSATANFPQ